jgi:hypothetical protein
MKLMQMFMVAVVAAMGAAVLTIVSYPASSGAASDTTPQVQVTASMGYALISVYAPDQKKLYVHQVKGGGRLDDCIAYTFSGSTYKLTKDEC